MTRYNIYGIGGAIIDTEVEVSDKFLVDAGIEKGVMTLVNESRQSELLDSLISENLKLVKKCGGSVCNSVVAAASLGAKAFFSGKVADDADGELYVNDLKKAGVGYHSAERNPGVTGKCLVMITKDAERSMNTFLGASEHLSMKEIDKETLKKSEWLYVEGYLMTDERRTMTIKEVTEFARANGVKIAISLSDPFIVSVYGDSLRDVMGSGVDLIFCNKDEALAFTKTDDLSSAVEKLKLITKSFAITDGINGAVICDGDSVFRSVGVPVKAIDTNGAGDMFAGAFLFAICLGKDFGWAASLANDCASRVVAKFGPRLVPEEFVAIKAKFLI